MISEAGDLPGCWNINIDVGLRRQFGQKHMKRSYVYLTALALVALTVTSIAQRDPRRTLQRIPTSIVTDSLTTALTGPSGEYAAYAAYSAVILKFGPVEPFKTILSAEARHIAALKMQMEKYGMAVPANQWMGTITAPATLTDAALMGVEAEKNNAAMYDQLIVEAKDYPDLVRTFGNLQDASYDNHLPAFEAAAEGTFTTVTTTACPAGLQMGRKR